MAIIKKVIREILECQDCEGEVYICDGCGNYFENEREVICKNGKHYDVECYEDDKK